MRVVVDGKPQLELTAAHERGIRPMREVASVEGAVLSPDEATQAYATQQKTLFVILGAIVLVLTTSLSLLAAPQDQALVLAVIAAANLALWVFFYVILRRRMAAWNAALAQRSLGLPPAGTRVRIDAMGLTVDDRLLERAALRIDQVELSEHRARGVSIFLIERLSLATASEVVVLDSAMIGNGRLLTGNVWRRLQGT